MFFSKKKIKDAANEQKKPAMVPSIVFVLVRGSGCLPKVFPINAADASPKFDATNDISRITKSTTNIAKNAAIKQDM